MQLCAKIGRATQTKRKATAVRRQCLAITGKSLEVCLTSQNESCRCATIQIEIGVDWCPQKSTWRRFGGRCPIIPPWMAPPNFLHARRDWHDRLHAPELIPSDRSFAMKLEEPTEDEIILDFAVSDEALEHAADMIFSLGNCTDARMCQAPNDPRGT